MISDNERREVARRLRELGKVVYDPENTYELLADALGVDDFEGTDELFNRLADLIEPSYKPDAKYEAWYNSLSHYGSAQGAPSNIRELIEEIVWAALTVDLGPNGNTDPSTGIDEGGVYTNNLFAEWEREASRLSGGIDRDALLELADSMDGYARFCKERSIQVGNNLVECYASLIREAVNACEGDSDAPTAGDDVKGGIDAHADGNEAAEGARTPSIEVFQWVKDHGGLDEVKRRVWASNELEAKLRSRERKIERLKKQLGYAEAKNAERRAGAKWLKEHGGLCAVRRRVRNADNRLMPEGMEWLVEAWPRYEDDAPLKLGDIALIDGEADMVEAVQLWIHGKPVIYGDGGSQQLERGERVKRPAPKALDADGVEIRVGDTVYYVDGREQRVNTVARLTDDGCVQLGTINEAGYVTYCEGACIQPNLLTHRAPVLAADGRPLREGETVWHKSGLVCGVVETIDAGSLMHTTRYRGDDGTIYRDAAKDLVHKRPEPPDSWELLEEDCSMNTGVYTRERMGIDVKKVPAKESRRIDMMRDLVRRAKKLAGDA